MTMHFSVVHLNGVITGGRMMETPMAKGKQKANTLSGRHKRDRPAEFTLSPVHDLFAARKDPLFKDVSRVTVAKENVK